jgi:hypothetical protein
MGKILAAFGLVFVVLGLSSGMYVVQESQLFGLLTSTSIPYEQYTLPLFIGGTLLLIAGILLEDEKR